MIEPAPLIPSPKSIQSSPDLRLTDTGNGAAFAANFYETAGIKPEEAPGNEEDQSLDNTISLAVQLNTQPFIRQDTELTAPTLSHSLRAKTEVPLISTGTEKNAADSALHNIDTDTTHLIETKKPDIAKNRDQTNFKIEPSPPKTEIETKIMVDTKPSSATSRIPESLPPLMIQPDNIIQFEKTAPGTNAEILNNQLPITTEQNVSDLQQVGVESYSSTISESERSTRSIISDPVSQSVASFMTSLPAVISAQIPNVSNPHTLVPINNLLVVAAPTEIVDIISQSLAPNEDRPDRIIVQLDPPELGRISIDFKFDSQGLQHVTITGETPEALRQLRMMHSELIQALERNGLASGDMTFRQHDPHSQTNHDTMLNRTESELPEDNANAGPVISNPSHTPQKSIPIGGLDIKL